MYDVCPFVRWPVAFAASKTDDAAGCSCRRCRRRRVHRSFVMFVCVHPDDERRRHHKYMKMVLKLRHQSRWLFVRSLRCGRHDWEVENSVHVGCARCLWPQRSSEENPTTLLSAQLDSVGRTRSLYNYAEYITLLTCATILSYSRTHHHSRLLRLQHVLMGCCSLQLLTVQPTRRFEHYSNRLTEL